MNGSASSIQGGIAQRKPVIPNCHHRVRRSFQNKKASGKPKISAAIIASGKPMNQTNGSAHQIPFPLPSPTPQVVEVAITTPMTAANPSIDPVRNTDFMNIFTISPLKYRAEAIYEHLLLVGPARWIQPSRKSTGAVTGQCRFKEDTLMAFAKYLGLNNLNQLEMQRDKLEVVSQFVLR